MSALLADIGKIHFCRRRRLADKFFFGNGDGLGFWCLLRSPVVFRRTYTLLTPNDLTISAGTKVGTICSVELFHRNNLAISLKRKKWTPTLTTFTDNSDSKNNSMQKTDPHGRRPKSGWNSGDRGADPEGLVRGKEQGRSKKFVLGV